MPTKQLLPITLLFITGLTFSDTYSNAKTSTDIDESALQAEAMQLVKQFSGTLKPTLKEAFQTGGPGKAIEVCANKAPQIANELSNESAWQIKRVSLKPRNQDDGRADEWETQVLKQFELQQQAGVNPSSMIYSELVDDSYRFMKAQAVEGLCLNCHGTALSEEVSNMLQQYYPDDKATGYSLGEIRGAFSLSKPLSAGKL